MTLEPDSTNTNTPKPQDALFWFSFAAFGLGLLARLIHLADVPFTAAESELAELAFSVSKGSWVGTGAVPAYLGLTSVLFKILSASSFWARIVPVLAGSSLILLPYLWKHRLSSNAVKVLTLAIAFDPLLVIFSRQIVSPIIALSAFLWLVTALERGRPGLAGIFLAIGLLSGYWFWVLVLILLLAAAVVRITRRPLELPLALDVWNPHRWLLFFTGLAAGLFLISTSFFLNPSGLSGLGRGIVEFIDVLTGPYQIPAGLSILALIAYSITPIVFFVVCVLKVRDHQTQPVGRLFILIQAITLIACIIFSRKDCGLAAFLTIWLWIFVAARFERLDLRLLPEKFAEIALTTFFTALIVYVGISSRAIFSLSPGTAILPQLWLLPAAGLIILVMTFLLIRSGWSKELAWQSLSRTVILILVVVFLATTFNSLNAKAARAAMFTQSGPLMMSSGYVEDMLEEFERQGALKVENDIAVADGAFPAGFDWFLRNFNQQPTLGSETSGMDPEIIYTLDENLPARASNYRGLSFPALVEADWKAMRAGDYLRAFFGKELITKTTNFYFWVRSDLFIGDN